MVNNQIKPRRRIVCLLLKKIPSEAFSLQVFAESCHRFTPKIALYANEGLFLDLSGCQNLFSEKSFLLRVQTLARRFSLELQMGFAEDAPTALAMAHYQHFIIEDRLSLSRGENQDFPLLDKHGLPLEALLDYASPFVKDVDLGKKVLKMIEVNRKLGLKTLGHFLALPPFSLASRFGREGVEISARAGGRLEVGWPGFQPSERLLEKEDVEETVGLESLLFVLKKLVDRAMARLRGLGKRASVVRIEFKLEPWSILKKLNRTWQISFPLSQGSTVGVMPILQERLAFELGREPLQAPVQRIRFQIWETVPGRSAQRDFFDQKEEDLEKWGALISRLACKLGKENVFLARPVDRYLPEKSWTKAPDSESDFQRSSQPPVQVTREWPARILKNPEPLQLLGNDVLQSNGKRWKTTLWNGPERLCGEWWKENRPDRSGRSKGPGFSRDYYQVTTEKGDELWIFLDRQGYPPSFYLHGYFD